MPKILLFLLLGSALIGCTEREVILTREDLRLADSLFLVSRNEWSVKLEDSCKVFREAMLPVWIDSIRYQRLSEINLMLKKHEETK
jgi:hypothetical protein